MTGLIGRQVAVHGLSLAGRAPNGARTVIYIYYIYIHIIYIYVHVSTLYYYIFLYKYLNRLYIYTHYIYTYLGGLGYNKIYIN